MLYIHSLRQERIDVRDGDLFKRPSCVKQLNKEWPHRTAAVCNRSLRKTAVVFHKASEVGQHPVVDCYGFGFSLETVEKSQPSNRQGYEECPRFRDIPALRRRQVAPRPSACRVFNLSEANAAFGPMAQSQMLYA